MNEEYMEELRKKYEQERVDFLVESPNEEYPTFEEYLEHEQNK